MSTTQTIPAQVTDANHRPRGVMSIEVDFHQDGPGTVSHDGQTYGFTGKSGANRKTGKPVREMATQSHTKPHKAMPASGSPWMAPRFGKTEADGHPGHATTSPTDQPINPPPHQPRQGTTP